MSALQDQLGYKFKDPALLQTAVTHRSYGAGNNERLEFLGDSILNFTIAEALFKKFPQAPEGDLSRLRALLVKGETLAEIARYLGLGQYLRLGEGELKSGGSERSSILADSVEAIIGAIYLDSGFEIARVCVLGWFSSRLEGISLAAYDKDPKTELQEWLQARKQPLPRYEVVKIEGEAHRQQFTVSCTVSLAQEPEIATAASRRGAEKEAATLMLNRLGVLQFGK